MREQVLHQDDRADREVCLVRADHGAAVDAAKDVVARDPVHGSEAEERGAHHRRDGLGKGRAEGESAEFGAREQQRQAEQRKDEGARTDGGAGARPGRIFDFAHAAT